MKNCGPRKGYRPGSNNFLLQNCLLQFGDSELCECFAEAPVDVDMLEFDVDISAAVDAEAPCNDDGETCVETEIRVLPLSARGLRPLKKHCRRTRVC